MVSVEILLSYPECTVPFTYHTDASNKQLGYVISQNNKHIAFLSIILIKTQQNHTTTEKELLAIVGCFNQFPGILFGYVIIVFMYNRSRA